MEYRYVSTYEKTELNAAEQAAREWLLKGYEAFLYRFPQGGRMTYKLKVSTTKKKGRIPKKIIVEIIG